MQAMIVIGVFLAVVVFFLALIADLWKVIKYQQETITKLEQRIRAIYMR
jgi:hypothetical protein